MAEQHSRGTFTVRRRVIEKLAVHAALSVDDVMAQSAGLSTAFDDQATAGAALYRSLPSATSRDDGSSVAVTVALRWPSAVNEVCAQVCREVADELARMTGVRPESVDVDVAQLVSASQEPAQPARAGSSRVRSGFTELPSVPPPTDSPGALEGKVD